MSIYIQELEKAIKRAKGEVRAAMKHLRSIDISDVVGFKERMKQKPSFEEFFNAYGHNVGQSQLKSIKRNARIEFEVALEVYENYHSLNLYPTEIQHIRSSFFLAKEELDAKQEELDQAILALKAGKINEYFRNCWDYDRIVKPVIETTIPNMIKRYVRLGNFFNNSVELIEEGGAVAVIGEEKMKEFLAEYDMFYKDIVKFRLTIAEHAMGQFPELRSGKLKTILSKFEVLHANVTKVLKYLDGMATKYTNIDFMLQDLYGEAAPTSIFNLLLDDTKADIFIDGRFKNKETIKQNIMDRIKLCWKAGIDCFFDAGVIDGAKVDALRGIRKKGFEEVDFAFDQNVYQNLKDKIEKADLTTSLDIIEMASRARIAGNVYRPIPTLTFEQGMSDPYISTSYGVRSIVEKISPNLLLKVDKVGDVPGMEWVGNTTAQYMNYALLMSAGGGRVFMNKAALIAFAAISNSLVDVKAYIASVAGSSCVEEKSVLSAIGTVIWVYVDKDGKPITRNGKIRGKKNSNEGSSWNNWGGNLSFQERTIAEEWCKYLEKINATQAKFSLEFQKYINTLKSQILISSFVKGTWVKPEQDLAGDLSKIDGVWFANLKREDCIENEKKGFGIKNFKIFKGENGGSYIKLPYLREDQATTVAMVKALPQFQLDGEVKESGFAVKLGQSKWALTAYLGLYRLLKRLESQGIVLDWVNYFANGSDPLVKDYLKQFSCKWDWKKSPREETISLVYRSQVDAFATFRTETGKTIVDVRNEMEARVEWPVFQGIKTLWGYEPELSQSVIDQIEFVIESKKLPKEEWLANKAELLSKFPALVAKRLEQAVEISGFDPNIWNNTLATGIIGKGKSLPIDLHKLFTPWNDKISADNLGGEVSEAEMAKWLLVSFVKNKDDGACKSKDYKGTLQKIGEAEIQSKFDLDDEKSADPGQKMIPIGYMFGSPMKVRVAIMRRMKLGRVGATFQATEKKPTRLSTLGGAGAATAKSTLRYKEYMGIIPCGGKMSRTELPQIPSKLREDFLQSLNVDYEDVVAKPMDLQPLQEFVSEANSKSTKPLLISIDGFIIDGHHRWYANKDNDSITCVIVHMLKDELLEKAKAFEGSFIAKPTRFELLQEFFAMISSFELKTKSGNKLTPFQCTLDPYDGLLPGKVYLNMMEALVRIETEDLFSKIKQNITESLDGELLKTLAEMGVNLNSSAKLSNKFIDSINSKLADFARGAVITGINIPVHVFDAIPQGTVILPPSMRVKTWDGKKLALAFRYPIASATSVGVVNVIFGDDPRVKPLLEGYGIDFAAYPDVVFMSSGDKTNYQFDDDGDCFGILCEPKFIQQDWDLMVARAFNEFQGKYSKKALNEDGTYNKRKYSKKLWDTVKSWVAISMNLLERNDYDSQNIEMGDVKTDKNKKAMEVVDLRGYCTVEFQKWSHRDGRGPVGLISDLFTVILASGISGKDFTRLACIAGYILQHSIDSAKKEKLVIPPAVLLARVVWHTVYGKLELRPEVNDIVKEWNEAWEAMDKAKIIAIQKKANNLYFVDAEGNYYVEAEIPADTDVVPVAWLPTIETIEANAKKDDQVLFFAPSTLLANMSAFAIKGSYGTFDFFGTKVPVHPKLVDAADPTRYIAAHTLEIHEFTDEDGNIIAWKALSAFRKINIAEYLHFKTKSELLGEKDGKKIYSDPVIVWNQRVNPENFPAYFQDTFKGDIWLSYPNLVFKYTLRWAMELCFDGADNLKNFSALWDEKNELHPKHFVMPNFPWKIEQSQQFRPTENEEVTTSSPKNGKVTFLDKIDKKFQYELVKFFMGNVMYYHTESKVKWSVRLWNLMVDWAEAPMTMAEVVESEKFDRNSFYIAYTRVMRQVGLYLLAQDQYAPATEDHVNYVKTLNKNSSEFKQLTKYMIGDSLYEYKPNAITVRITGSINSRYRDQITKNGRNPDETWQPSFYNPTWKDKVVKNRYQIEPFWYVGSRAQWSNELKANVTDLVVASLNRHIPIYACDLTEALVEDLASIEDVHKYIKADNPGANPFVNTLIQHNQKHFKLTGKSITDCQCCQTHIRKFVTTTAREDRFEAGSKEYLEFSARRANVAIAKELITAVKAQCNFLVEKALLTNDYDFSDNAFGLSVETVHGYVEEFAPDVVKAKFGLPLQADFEAMDEWSKHWSNFSISHKSTFVIAISKETTDLWWNLPIAYLVHNLIAYKQENKLLPVAEDQEPNRWMSLKEWNEEPPTPPSGGGGGLPSGTGIASSSTPSKSEPQAKKQITLMVTGHRVIPSWVKDELARVVTKLQSKYKITKAISGMALGTDMLFAEEAIKQRLYLHCYLACKGQQRRWAEDQQARFRSIVNVANKAHQVTPGLFVDSTCYKKRDQAMVNDSSFAIVVFNGDQKTGTGMTKGMLDKKKVPYILINTSTKTTTMVTH